MSQGRERIVGWTRGCLWEKHQFDCIYHSVSTLISTLLLLLLHLQNLLIYLWGKQEAWKHILINLKKFNWPLPDRGPPDRQLEILIYELSKQSIKLQWLFWYNGWTNIWHCSAVRTENGILGQLNLSKTPPIFTKQSFMNISLKNPISRVIGYLRPHCFYVLSLGGQRGIGIQYFSWSMLVF